MPIRPMQGPVVPHEPTTGTTTPRSASVTCATSRLRSRLDWTYEQHPQDAKYWTTRCRGIGSPSARAELPA